MNKPLEIGTYRYRLPIRIPGHPEVEYWVGMLPMRKRVCLYRYRPNVHHPLGYFTSVERAELFVREVCLGQVGDDE